MIMACVAGLAAAGAARALVFQPPYEGLRVKVERFETGAFPRVELFFRVESSHKQDFRYLHPSNVRLYEEEVEIKEFDLDLDSPPLSLAMVLDDSGSIDKELEYLKMAASRFVDELGRLDEAAVVSFHRKAEILQDRTGRKDLLKEAIGKLRAYGATGLLDGALLGLEAIAAGKGQRKMLLVSDGNDQTYPGGRALSLETEGALIEKARASGTEIYTVVLGHHPDGKLLERIAQKTGGTCWYAPAPRHLREVFDAIARSFTAGYRIGYQSPNSRREKQDRTVVLGAMYQDHTGQGVGTYWLEREVPVAPVEIERRAVGGKGPGRVRLFTQGLLGRFLPVEFSLLDPAGKLVRSGRSTEDGFGRLDRPDPVLVGVKPGTYTLVLQVPGQPARFSIPGLEVLAGETTSRSVAFSHLVFTRDGEPWFDLQHPYGPTSELVQVVVEDALARIEAGEDPAPPAEDLEAPPAEARPDPTPPAPAGPAAPLFEGRLAELVLNRQAGLWLPEGVYDVRLENLWKDTDPGEDGDGAPLANELKARFQVLGGSELRFDVKRSDLVGFEDVLSPEYQASHPDENPFRTNAPRTADELKGAVSRQRDRYLAGEFSRHEIGTMGETGPYRYRNPDEVRARVAELENRYRGAEPANEDPPVDAGYLSAHGYGPEARARRIDEIGSHYLGGGRPSFPDHAEASPRFGGGPGDRFDGVSEMRIRRDVKGSLEGRQNQDAINDMRERVAYRQLSPEARADSTPMSDPATPGEGKARGELMERIRQRVAAEFHDFPTAEELPNMDRPRGPKAKAPGPRTKAPTPPKSKAKPPAGG